MRHYGKNLVGISIESVELMLTELRAQAKGTQGRDQEALLYLS